MMFLKFCDILFFGKYFKLLLLFFVGYLLYCFVSLVNVRFSVCVEFWYGVNIFA